MAPRAWVGLGLLGVASLGAANAAGCGDTAKIADGADATVGPVVGPPDTSVGDVVAAVDAQAPEAAPIDDGPPLVNPSKYNTVLGRPTDSSIAISVLAAAAGDKAWIEYGTQVDSGRTALIGAKKTEPVASAGGAPIVVDIGGLSKDTKYYYRVHYQPGGQGDSPDNLHTFRTQRAKGRTFHFGVQGDTHPERANNKMFHADLFTLTMEQVRDRQPDLYFTLGDDFSIEKIIENFKTANYGANYRFRRSVEGAASYATYQSLSSPFSQPMITDGVSAPQSNAAYLEMRQKYFGLMASATPLLLTNGNHEQAHLANLGGIFNNASIWAADGRLKYDPLPAPGGFYSGDESKLAPVNGYPTLGAPDGYLRDYFAFTWGDALFVTLDPYWHSPTISPDSTLFSDPEPNGAPRWATSSTRGSRRRSPRATRNGSSSSRTTSTGTTAAPRPSWGSKSGGALRASPPTGPAGTSPSTSSSPTPR